MKQRSSGDANGHAFRRQGCGCHRRFDRHRLFRGKALPRSGRGDGLCDGTTENRVKPLALGDKAVPVVADSAKIADLEHLRARIEADGRKIDVLFANAGIAENNDIGATDEGLFDRIFDVNVKGVFYTVQALLPVIRDGGNIVLTGSIVGNKGMERLSAQPQAAVRSFARSFANDLKGRGIA